MFEYVSMDRFLRNRDNADISVVAVESTVGVFYAFSIPGVVISFVFASIFQVVKIGILGTPEHWIEKRVGNIANPE